MITAEVKMTQLDMSNAPKMTEWENEPTQKDLKEDFEAAKITQTDFITKIKVWRDLLNITGSAKIKPVKGRSSVQPKLIRRTAEWRYSALTEPFLSSEKMYKVSPVTFEDEDAAKQNELVINWQFRTKLNAVKFIDEYVRTTVDEGTCIVRVGWVRETVKEKVQAPVWGYRGFQDEQEQANFEDALKMHDENYNFFLNSPEEYIKAIDYYHESGMPNVAFDTGEMEEIEQPKVIQNRPTLEMVNPENLFVDPSCEGDISKARFMVLSFETSKAELIRDGRYKNLSAINYSASEILSQPDHKTETPNNFNFKDDLRKRIIAYEYWGLSDIHGTGQLVPIVATWIGSVLIRLEENPFPDQKPPFVMVPYLPVKRAIYGETDAELLEDNQKILGAVTRGMIDLMGRSANSQQGTVKGMLDATNKRRFDNGQDYEFNPNTHPNNGLVQHVYPEIPASAMNMLGLQNQEAEALSGVKAFSGGMSGNAYGDVAAGIRGMLDAASKREMAILRRLAQGMQEIGTKIIQMNQVFMSEEEIIRVTNKVFQKVRREDIQGNFDLEVDISTAEVDNAKSQDLSFMLQTMGPGMDFEIQKMIFSEIAELKRMPSLAHRIQQYQRQPDPLVVEEQKLKIAKLQKELEVMDSEIALNAAKAKKEAAVADNENLNFVEQETGTTHERDLQKQRAQAQGNADLEVTKALLKGRKPDEKPGNIAAAIGYNEISEKKDHPKPPPPAPAPASTPLGINPNRTAQQNIGSVQFDPRQDPALNPALGL